jgi:hypothetical protein
VRDGSLRYCVEEPTQPPQTLTVDVPGIVVAERLHRVELTGPVRFYVEFYRRPTA